MVKKSLIFLTSLLLLWSLPEMGFAKTSASAGKTKAQSKSKHNKKNRHKKTKIKSKSHSGDYMDGVASYYASRFAGHKTSSGKRLNMEDFSAAHPTLAMGTKLKVTNVSNGKSVYVVVNDRMPKRSGHVIDLTVAGAKQIGIYGGIGHVQLELLSESTFNYQLNKEMDGAYLSHEVATLESGPAIQNNKSNALESDYQATMIHRGNL
jgi:rare lipoprotein A